MLFLEVNVLLAIGLLALLVIFLVARTMNDRGLFAWLKRFEPSPDRGHWGRVDRELDTIPGLAGLDPRERRLLYMEVSRSLDGWNSRSMWFYGMLMASTVVLAPVTTRLGDAAVALTAENPVLGKLPPFLVAGACGGLVYMIPVLLLFSRRHSEIVRRIRHQTSQTGPAAVS